MLLAIDVGNTNTVFAVCKGEKILQSWRCRTIATRTADEYAAFLSELFTLEDIRWRKIQHVIIGSVVPDADFHLTKFCEKYLEQEPIFVSADIVNIVVDIDTPAEIGADRLINALAIQKHYKTPAIVVDFGTATTFDVIDARGRYIGGIIAPGINLSLQALHEAASKLPKINIEKPEFAIGKGTVTAMQSGIFWGYTSMINGLLEKITTELRAEPFVLGTGGLASLFSRSMPVINIVDEDLTLKGLLQIHADYVAQRT